MQNYFDSCKASYGATVFKVDFVGVLQSVFWGSML